MILNTRNFSLHKYRCSSATTSVCTTWFSTSRVKSWLHLAPPLLLECKQRGHWLYSVNWKTWKRWLQQIDRILRNVSCFVFFYTAAAVEVDERVFLGEWAWSCLHSGGPAWSGSLDNVCHQGLDHALFWCSLHFSPSCFLFYSAYSGLFSNERQGGGKGGGFVRVCVFQGEKEGG